jgi:DNA-binding LytR/AlgR family response regulator
MMQTSRNATKSWVLVVEDEDRLRENMIECVTLAAPDFGPVNAAGSAEAALELCEQSFPAVAFIDIQLPGISGLELAGILAGHARIVFVTAYDNFAVQAFEYGAIDYLLKPVSRQRVQVCIDRLRERERSPADALQTLLRSISPPVVSSYSKWLAASSGRRTHFISVDDMIYLKSDSKYTRVVCRDGEHLVEESLKKLLLRFDPAQFRQVHRSAVVNLREVLLVERDDVGGGLVKFRSHSDVVRISAPYLRELRTFLV